MASTQKAYKLGGRLPRYDTKLATFVNGMYLTEQNIPEGYAKVMVNYDIDDTGSHIKPRRGRIKEQVLPYESKSLAGITLTDYVYTYNPATETSPEETAELIDLVMSYGRYTNMTEVTNIEDLDYSQPVYLGYMLEHKDTGIYVLEDGDWVLQQAGEESEELDAPLWAAYYNKADNQFHKIPNATSNGVGYITARDIKNAYAFDKEAVETIHRPVHTVLNNELIAFAGDPLTFYNYPNTTERNTLDGFNEPVISKIKIKKLNNEYTLTRDDIDVRVLNPSEALSSGFNILSDTPYLFENEEGGTTAIVGILPYEQDNMTIPTVNIHAGEALTLRVYYQYPIAGNTLQLKIEELDMSNDMSTWNTLQDFTDTTYTAGADIDYTYAPKVNRTALRFTIRKEDDSTTEYPYTIYLYPTTRDIQLRNFKLNTCKGMISWQGCVGVYGVADAKDTIFFSDIADPGYFPFPNNALTFDNEVLAVHNYLDHLIVVTVDSIYLVSAGVGIAGSVQKKILTNINIPEIDAINLVVLKDQVFFKTDTQFYVLKPNKYTSDSTDLKNYTNSTSIANFTNNFSTELVRLFNDMYPLITQRYSLNYRQPIKFVDFTVHNIHSIVKDEEVHYIYRVLPIFGNTDIRLQVDYLNLHLIYNSLTRSWRLYLASVGLDTEYKPILYRNKQSGEHYEFFPHGVTTPNGVHSEVVITRQTYDTVSDSINTSNWSVPVESYNNFPFINTGTIALDDALTRRFRELQISLLNMDPTKINFYADFLVDGQERIQATHYELQHITNIDDPDYGKIFITPIEVPNIELHSTTTLSDSTLEDDHWALDLSKFPDLSVVTIRFRLQGRGRRGSLKLLNTSLKRYQLGDMNWVYRNMSGR